MAWSRRGVLGAGLAAAASSALGSRAQGTRPLPQGTDPGQANPASRPFPFEEMTIRIMDEGLVAGRFTSRQLTEAYLARIEEIDRKGPTLRAVLEINPDALEIADALDKERKEKGDRGPLHGIPILVKDNLDTADKMSCTAGSLALEGSHPLRDSTVVAKLRAAGAIILGKTNLSEWANFRSTHSTSGWSGRGGQTLNPYALDRCPSGSSSGSAAAVAANLCAAAIGTETDGSITSPSSACGLVGIKPTVGLVSRAGIVPISRTQDTAGPMARTVRDAVTLLEVIAGPDPRDPATKNARPYQAGLLEESSLEGVRIGIVRGNFAGYSAPADKVTEEALKVFQSEGAKVVDPVELDMTGIGDAELEVLLYEFKAGLAEYLASLGPKARVRTLEDVIAFDEKNRDREMPLFAQELFEQARKKGGLSDPKYKKALAKCGTQMREKGIDAVLRKHKLDALFAPTGTPAWLIDHVNGDPNVGSFTTPAAVAGYPHVTVPAGFASGLPVGASFIGPRFSEVKLLDIAWAYEDVTRVRKAPRFLPHAEEKQPS
ncbi:MAG: amidase [Myxococcales bacterium]